MANNLVKWIDYDENSVNDLRVTLRSIVGFVDEHAAKAPPHHLATIESKSLGGSRRRLRLVFVSAATTPEPG